MKLDGHSAPEDVIAEGSALWGVFKGFRSLGLHLLQIPKGLGGMAEDLDPMAAILVTEQLGYADSGLTISMGVSCPEGRPPPPEGRQPPERPPPPRACAPASTVSAAAHTRAAKVMPIVLREAMGEPTTSGGLAGTSILAQFALPYHDCG